MKITILGGGSWGIALAVLLHSKKHSVRMWEFSPKDAEMLRTKREHAIKLPGIKIPDDILITSDMKEAVDNAEFVLCVVPSQTMRATMKSLVSSVEQKTLDAVRGWIIASKGIECGTLNIMTEVLAQEIPGLGNDRLVVLSGPSHAEEVSRNIPTTVVAASENHDLAKQIQKSFSTDTFRIYTNADPRGVELAASVKNVIALAAGIADGLGLGDNTKGALLTRGMAEIVRLGHKMGAAEQTFFGLAGVGDLITTCISKHSRNRNMGELIGQGLTLEQALAKMVMVAEGVETAKSAYALSKKHNIEMPITTEVYKALFEGKPAKEAVRDLMMRDSKPERW